MPYTSPLLCSGHVCVCVPMRHRVCQCVCAYVSLCVCVCVCVPKCVSMCLYVSVSLCWGKVPCSYPLTHTHIMFSCRNFTLTNHLVHTHGGTILPHHIQWQKLHSTQPSCPLIEEQFYPTMFSDRNFSLTNTVSLTMGITPKICLLCVCVMINQRSFEPFMLSDFALERYLLCYRQE